jgi:hypothetical protein
MFADGELRLSTGGRAVAACLFTTLFDTSFLVSTAGSGGSREANRSVSSSSWMNFVQSSIMDNLPENCST